MAAKIWLKSVEIQNVCKIGRYFCRVMDSVMGIFDLLLSVDEYLLLRLNGLHSPVLDVVMWTLSDRWVWLPFYVALAVVVFWRKRPAVAVCCLLLVALMITATDQTCASLIRPWVGRLRPSSPGCALSAAVHVVNGYRGGPYGFPSCHAANTFALAMYLMLVLRWRPLSVTLMVWSAAVSYSRVYLGVHYPGDVLAGMAVGAVYAAMAAAVLGLMSERCFRRGIRVGRLKNFIAANVWRLAK